MSRDAENLREDDKSDESTRNRHTVRRRADGTEAIVAMRSSNDVVRRFRLRSNSVSVPGSAKGSLLFEDREKLNLELEEEAQKKYLMTESNKSYQRWKTAMVFIVISQIGFAPVNFAFKPELSLQVRIFDDLVDLCFLVDLVLHFFVATKDKTGHIMTSRKANILHYIKHGTFMTDIVTSVPLDKVLDYSQGIYGNERNSHWLTTNMRAARTLRFRKLLSVGGSIMNNMDASRFSSFFYSSMSQYAKIVLGFVLLLVGINYFAVIWHNIGWVASGLGWDYWDKKTRCESTWAYNDFVHEQLEDGNSYVYEGTVLYSNVSDLVGLMAKTTADCLKYKVYDGNDYSDITADFLTALITSLVLLLTGENLEPVTELEKVTMLVMLIIGVFTISIVFGGVHSVVSSLQARTTAYQLKMESIHDAMDRMNLPESLSERIFYYYDYIHMEHGTLDGNVVGFLPEVTKKLQAEIYLWQRYQLVVGVPFFKNINSRIIQDIVVKLEVEVYLPGDFVITKDDMGSTMYFIYAGQCQVIIPLTSAEIRDLARSRGGENEKKQRKSSVTLKNALTAVKKVVTVGEGDDSDSDSDSELRTSDRPRPSGMFGRTPTAGKVSTRQSGRGGRKSSVGSMLDAVKLGVGSKYKIAATLNAGQHFGEVALVLQSKRTASIRSKGVSELCVLNKAIYDQVAQQYPEDAQLMREAILSKYGHLKHAETEMRKSMKMPPPSADMNRKLSTITDEPESPKTPKSGKGRFTFDTPDRGLTKNGSSTMTMPTDLSTPSDSRSITRENSAAGVGGVPASPTSDLKKMIDDFKGNMNLISFASDRAIGEEKDVSKQIDLIEDYLKSWAEEQMRELEEDSDDSSDDESSDDE
ncbi:hypothetical protein TeGR_g7364 [Tetraparma gracilis]|uniref:Cyclic nucleotide-binding domain-containing protein n=1 Tax=Tetraparma gracilis TaxID=2962635 RepID=A0ABQ6MTW7_9STRA|nr:hypothetical protein TeGR_g7364 [Tetraparma gracilis]